MGEFRGRVLYSYRILKRLKNTISLAEAKGEESRVMYLLEKYQAYAKEINALAQRQGGKNA